MKKNTITLISLIAVILVVCLGFIFWQRATLEKPEPTDKTTTEEITTKEETTEIQTETVTEAETTRPLANNPHDFSALKEQNPDIYAWIEMPGTAINYPIVQHPTSEEFYLRRDYLGNYSVCGCIFTQHLNSKEFTDPNTVIYGHYMTDGTFFGALHNYRNPDYLKEYPYFYIYLPGHVLVYEIFAAYQTDNSHILYSYDFSDEAVFEKYLLDCQRDLFGKKTVNPNISLTKDSRIVTLSTCVQNSDPNYRYIVQGALIDDMPSN